MKSDYTMTVMLKALSPITHMSGTEGNEAVLMREPVVFDNAVRYVPTLSGNALRHRMFRESGYLDLLAQWGLLGHLSLAQLNFLLHGGNRTEKGAATDMKRTAAGQEAIPLLRLLGGCLPDEIMNGWMDVGRGLMLCLENQPRIKAIWPEASLSLVEVFGGQGDYLYPAEHFVRPYQYTRGDAHKYFPAGGDGEANQMMIFSGQCVVAGAVFIASIRIRNASLVQVGAACRAVEAWDGNVGGQRSRGHGNFEVSYRVCGRGQTAINAPAAIALYLAHMHLHREAGVRWLYETFDLPIPSPHTLKEADHAAR